MKTVGSVRELLKLMEQGEKELSLDVSLYIKPLSRKSGEKVQLTSAEMRLIADALKQNKTLTSLNFVCGIDVVGALLIADALKQNKTLKHLKLGYQKFSSPKTIGNKGAKYIAEALKENNTLITLDLQNSNIGVSGAKAIAEALKENNSLAHLNLASNNIGAKSVKAIAEALKENNAITHLNIDNNPIGPTDTWLPTAEIMRNSLEKNNALAAASLQAKLLADAKAEDVSEKITVPDTKKPIIKLDEDSINQLADLLMKEASGGKHIYENGPAEIANLKKNIGEILKKAVEEHGVLNYKFKEILKDKEIIKKLGKTLAEEPELFKDNMSKNFLYACVQKIYNFFASLFKWDSSYLKGTVNLISDEIPEQKQKSFVEKLKEEAKSVGISKS